MLRRAGITLIWSITWCASVWAAGAIYFSTIHAEWVRLSLLAVFVAAFVAVLRFVRPLRRAWAVSVSLIAVVVIWFLLTPASNDRDWAPEVARTPRAAIDGDVITVHDVRNFDYRSETDFDVAYEDRTYRFSELRSLDLIMSFWGPTDIAHTFLSFGFTGDRYLSVSIETRKQKGEFYSALRGLFRQYELIYVFGDERDLIRLRTNYRGERVFIYHLRTPPDRREMWLREYLRRANELADHPEWYNAITSSCGTNILFTQWRVNPNAVFQISYLLNGHWAEIGFRNGWVKNDMPFDELQRLSDVTERAKAADQAPDFSRRIREGLPIPSS